MYPTNILIGNVHREERVELDRQKSCNKPQTCNIKRNCTQSLPRYEAAYNK